MAEIKTKQTEASVTEFVENFANSEQKKKDSYELIKIMQDISGFEPKMWGPSIIGFGKYHYKSEKSKQEGDWPIIGFSPRKAAISLYVFTGRKDQEYLLKDLGKFKLGKACIYVNKLSDININSLTNLIKETINYMNFKYGKS